MPLFIRSKNRMSKAANQFNGYCVFVGCITTIFSIYTANKFNFYKPAVAVLVELLKQAKSKKILDIAAGAGGPWQSIIAELSEQVPEIKISLSDLFPNTEALSNLQNQFPNQFEIYKIIVTRWFMIEQLFFSNL